MQGTVFGPLQCAVSMDKLGKLAYRSGKPLLKYKNMVYIPPLGMIDDVIAMDKCGKDSIRSNSIISAFVDSKKQSFGIKKCHKMHVGQNLNLCPELKINGLPLENTKSEKYLGDIISHDGKNEDNINERKNKAWGIVSQILAILSEVPFGKYEMQAALLMRNALFLNGILTNSQVRYGLKDDYIEVFELHILVMRKVGFCTSVIGVLRNYRKLSDIMIYKK